MPQDIDRVDVQRVLAGEIDAFAGIVSRWQQPLLTLAYRFCRDRQEAEELAQDAFVRAFRFLHQWRGDAAFSTWLFAVALNVFRSAARRARRRDRSLTDAARAAAPPAAIDPADAGAHEAVRLAVARLPRRYRDPLILYYFLDQNVTEAARVLGVPEGTFKARLHRGRALLRERMPETLAMGTGSAR